jgi:bifunctional non-homologous end joining protein LigD
MSAGSRPHSEANSGASALAELRAAPAQEQPSWVSPMLATLSGDPFSDPDWLFERKLDGVRALAYRSGEQVRLYSRTRHSINRTYPEIVDALTHERCEDFVIDGEVVAFEGERTSFERLQQRLGISDPERARRTGVEVFYYVFDVMHLEGHDTTGLPLLSRKGLLREYFDLEDPLRLLDHELADGQRLYGQACRDGWEGLIAKRSASRYRSGRSRDWLKLKCVNEQEFVIGGWTEPSGSRTAFGALLIGYHDENGALRYAGKVGTGYSERVLAELGKQLVAIEQAVSPFSGTGSCDLPRRGVHFAKPKLVAQVGFTELTREGKLRHPRFLGMRDDKPAKEVVLERPT